MGRSDDASQKNASKGNSAGFFGRFFTRKGSKTSTSCAKQGSAESPCQRASPEPNWNSQGSTAPQKPPQTNGRQSVTAFPGEPADRELQRASHIDGPACFAFVSRSDSLSAVPASEAPCALSLPACQRSRASLPPLDAPLFCGQQSLPPEEELSRQDAGSVWCAVTGYFQQALCTASPRSGGTAPIGRMGGAALRASPGSGAPGRGAAGSPPPLVVREVRCQLGWPEAGEPVWLHIYDVSAASGVRWVNELARPIGTGAFHIGVEVFGKEWSYGFTPGCSTGVYCVLPRQNTQHKYRESIELGPTPFSRTAVLAILESMKIAWGGQDYDLLLRNCCHFAEDFLRHLSVASAPGWAMNLATAGARVAGAGAAVVGGVDQAVQGAHATADVLCAIDQHYRISDAFRDLFLSRDSGEKYAVGTPAP